MMEFKLKQSSTKRGDTCGDLMKIMINDPYWDAPYRTR